MMAKPIEALELHYPMIQFLIICIIPGPVSYYPKKKTVLRIKKSNFGGEWAKLQTKA